MFTKIKDKIKNLEKIVVLTGAGISAASGIHTYRDDDNESIWIRYNPEEVANIHGFKHDPYKCWEFYNVLMDELNGKEPNEAHYALARLENEIDVPVTIITQNVDNLHQKAGSKNVIEVHGTMYSYRCNKCKTHFNNLNGLNFHKNVPLCSSCRGAIRPNIVMFGETPLHLSEIDNLLMGTDTFLYEDRGSDYYDMDRLFLQIGTSALVSPVSEFALISKMHRFTTVYVDLNIPDNYKIFNLGLKGSCVDILPKLVDFLITNKQGV